jgi:hypothetical protein
VTRLRTSSGMPICRSCARLSGRVIARRVPTPSKCFHCGRIVDDLDAPRLQVPPSLTSTQVGALLGVAPSTVRVRAYRARNARVANETAFGVGSAP